MRSPFKRERTRRVSVSAAAEEGAAVRLVSGERDCGVSYEPVDQDGTLFRLRARTSCEDDGIERGDVLAHEEHAPEGGVRRSVIEREQYRLGRCRHGQAPRPVGLVVERDQAKFHVVRR